MDGTATAEDIMNGKTAWVDGEQITGNLVTYTCHVSASEPNVSDGNDGDIWLVTEV